MDEIIRLQDITKTYGLGANQVPVLKGINLRIKIGEFVSIMGPSGSGKSTLMNILGCLDRPTTGQYYLAGEEVSSLNNNQLAYVRNRQIGFVFQSFNLLPKLSGVDNVALPMVYAGVGSKQRQARAQELLTKLGLGERMNHLPSALSGGQRQRVAIARALANKPGIIMADEPTGNLDSKASLEVMEIFKNLHEAGHTIILVTHEQDIAAYAKRHVIIKDGLIQEDSGEGGTVHV